MSGRKKNRCQLCSGFRRPSAGFFAIEVKNSTKVFPKDLHFLKAFKEDYPQARTYLLYRGKDRLKMGDIYCLPVSEFLMAINPRGQNLFQVE
ncbi:MAG: hypothetical protein HQM09_05800 [Candidatus Riflebacteria bacterium]|nr:hypothetical protein [Candidatus Riflebacteria bacterium]